MRVMMAQRVQWQICAKLICHREANAFMEIMPESWPIGDHILYKHKRDETRASQISKYNNNSH